MAEQQQQQQVEASDARAAKLKALLDRSSQREGAAAAQKALQEKMQLKIYLEAMKSKTRRIGEAQKAAAAVAASSPMPPPPPAAAPLHDESLVHDWSRLSSEEARDAARAAATTVRARGVVLVAGCARHELLDECRQRSLQRLDELLGRSLHKHHHAYPGELGRRGLSPDGLKTKELVCRNVGRFDLAHDDEAMRKLSRQGPWAEVTKRVLGVDSYLLKCGVVISQPGALQQTVHADGKHLFDDEPHLPPHCVTVFVPLVDMTPDLGPTEFFPDTHRADAAPELLARAMHGVAPGVSFDSAKKGDAVIFDYRIRHRGLANTTPTTQRPLAYFTYAKSWFRDATNYSDLSLYAD